MNYYYSTVLEKRNIPFTTYSIETTLAEKIETISSRNITTTGLRDFFDLFMLFKLYINQIDTKNLSKAICINGESNDLKDYEVI